MKNETVEYYDGSILLEGYLSYDETRSGTKPLILIIHAWAGRDEFVCKKADQLAELGYVGFALDMYGKGVLGNSVEENSKLMNPFMKDRLLISRRVNAALNKLKEMNVANNNNIAIIGYCFGGLCALDMARNAADVNAVVSFHGNLTPPNPTVIKDISAKILVCHGYDDPMVPPDQLMRFTEEMKAAKADWQVHMYGNTMHAFTFPPANDPDFGTVYNALSDRRSWNAMRVFFKEVFSN